MNPNHDDHGRFAAGESVTIVHEATGSTAKLVKQPNGMALVTGVETPAANKHQGGAHGVMNKVEAFLDSHSPPLAARLVAVAIDDDVTTPGLVKLYSAHGFKRSDHFEMIRPAKT